MGERVVYSEHPRMFRNNPVRFVLDALTIPFVIGLIDLMGWWIRCLSSTLTITESKTSLRNGILSRELNEISNSNVRNVVVRQSFFQRIMNVGHIGISTSGQSGFEIEIDGMHDPLRVKRIIEGSKSESSNAASPPDWLASIVLAVCILVGSMLLWYVLSAIRSTSTAVVDRINQSSSEIVPVSSLPKPNTSLPEPVKQNGQRAIEQSQSHSEDSKPSNEINAETKSPSESLPVVTSNSNPDSAPVGTESESNPKSETSPSEQAASKDENEKKAAGKMKLVKPFLSRGNKSSAIKRLEEIIKEYPDTKTASEAKDMLIKLK